MRKQHIISLILLIVVLVLIIVSLFTPYYNYQFTKKNGDTEKLEYTYYFKHLSGEYIKNGKSIDSIDIDYDDIDDSPYASEDNSIWIFTLTFWFTIFSLILCICSIIFLAIFLSEYMKKFSFYRYSKEYIGITILIIFITFILFAVLIHMDIKNDVKETEEITPTEFKDEMENIDFWTDINYNYQGSEYSIVTGPAYGWYSIIIAGILCIPAFIILYKYPVLEERKPENYQKPIINSYYYPSQENRIIKDNFCSECGAKLKDNAKFCRNCGIDLREKNK